MRPVNLIPPDERRGDSAPLRTGSMIYVLIVGLGLLLLGIVAVALTSKQISDRQQEKSSLQQDLATATSRAQSVQAFTTFRTVQEQRQATVASLAQSRFDWSRVLHELALVLPSDIQLTALTGTVTPDVQIDSGASSSSGTGTSLRADVKGPALEIDGCAPSQDSTASFVAALEDIDGVTRVGLDSSKIPDTGGSLTGEPGDQSVSGSSSSNGCPQAKPYTFTIVAAFDAVPTPSTASAAPSVPAAPTASAAPSGQATSNDQVSDGQTEEKVQKAATNQQISRAQTARATVLGGG